MKNTSDATIKNLRFWRLHNIDIINTLQWQVAYLCRCKQVYRCILTSIILHMSHVTRRLGTSAVSRQNFSHVSCPALSVFWLIPFHCLKLVRRHSLASLASPCKPPRRDSTYDGMHTLFCRSLTSVYDESKKKTCKLLTNKVQKSQHWMCRWFSQTQTIKND